MQIVELRAMLNQCAIGGQSIINIIHVITFKGPFFFKWIGRQVRQGLKSFRITLHIFCFNFFGCCLKLFGQKVILGSLLPFPDKAFSILAHVVFESTQMITVGRSG